MASAAVLNIFLLLDTSASMTGAPLEALRQGGSPPTSRITLTIRVRCGGHQTGREVEVRVSV